jgi:ribosomal-protein-alanine N-acetyltransferase
MRPDLAVDVSVDRDILIGPLRWWQLDEVAALERTLFPGDAWQVDQFWQELAQPTRHYVAATVHGEVVGYAGAFLLPPDSDVQTIAVAADWQRAGIGAALLDHLAEAARACGCTHQLLEVRADNTGAIELYRRHDFDVISSRTRYYPDGCDALIMRRRLGGSR